MIGAVVASIAIAAYCYYALYRPDPALYPVQGIDISHHQRLVRWSEVAKGGIAFAYIKATEGGSFRDTRFTENWKGARDAGITRGAYHFYTLCRPPEVQAANFIATVPKEAGILPPVLDLEFGGNCKARPPADDVRASLKKMSDALFAAYGVRPLLYVTREFLSVYGRTLPEHAGLWLRSIAWTPRWSDPAWVFWQYHNRGTVIGIDGPVDRNVYRGSITEFAAFAGRANEGITR